MRKSCALMPPTVEDEIVRIRHSGLMNANVFKLDSHLQQIGVTADDFNEYASAMPDDMIDVLVQYMEGKLAERDQLSAKAKDQHAMKDKLLNQLEDGKDKVEKMKHEYRCMSEKCSAMAVDHKSLIMVEREVRSNVAKATVAMSRQTEKFSVDAKKGEIERERLTNLMKKFVKS